MRSSVFCIPVPQGKVLEDRSSMLVNLLRLITFEANLIDLWVLAVNVCFVVFFCFMLFMDSTRWEHYRFCYVSVSFLWNRGTSEKKHFFFASRVGCHIFPVSEEFFLPPCVLWTANKPAELYCKALLFFFFFFPSSPPPVFQHHAISNGS